MSGHIIAIFVAPSKHGSQIEAEAVQLKSGKGIVGDRFFGTRKNQPGRNLTLIESEDIAEFNRAFQANIPLHATRRNLITQGIRLSELVDSTFKIGNVLCRGIELCEPCKLMAKQIPVTPLSQVDLIQAFTHKGGIRAQILLDGVIRVNDLILHAPECG